MFQISANCIKAGKSRHGIFSISHRYYQCEHGVYGYRPKKAEPFERKASFILLCLVLLLLPSFMGVTRKEKFSQFTVTWICD